MNYKIQSFQGTWIIFFLIVFQFVVFVSIVFLWAVIVCTYSLCVAFAVSSATYKRTQPTYQPTNKPLSSFDDKKTFFLRADV